jgi:homocysteine S-methyltransferase
MTAEVKVLDGGFSTQLALHVGDIIDGDPLWASKFLVSNPDAVYQTHLDFLRAGSDIIQTNTYQATVPGFVHYLNKSKEESLELIKSAVDLAKGAVKQYKEEIRGSDVSNPEPLIAGSIGPYAAYSHDCSEYTGELCNKFNSMQSIIDWHRPRFEVLVNNNVDLLAIETIPCANEALALTNLLKEYPGKRFHCITAFCMPIFTALLTKLPSMIFFFITFSSFHLDVKAWISFSCKSDGKSIVDGTNFKDTILKCYKSVNPGQLVACGVNCLAPRAVTPLLKTISQQEIHQFIPMVAYPNSGEKYSSTTFTWTIDNDVHPPEEFIKEWLDLGVRYVGGCCRTNANYIKRISSEVKKWTKDRLASI